MSSASIAVTLAAAACAAVPWIITNDYYVNLASQILIYALLALSLNLLLGYGGMVSLGHAAFLGLTGYSTILLVVAGYDQLTPRFSRSRSRPPAARCSGYWRCAPRASAF